MKQNEKRQAAQRMRIDNKLIEMEKRLEALTLDLAAANRVKPQPGSAVKSDRGLGSSAGNKSPANAENAAELNRVREIIASTGLDLLALKENVDPEVFNRMYSDYADRQRVSDHRQSLFERNESQHRTDDEQFDEYLDELYRRARSRRGTNKDSQDREAAFAEMLAKYPEAYATSMIIAERAFSAMWSSDPDGVENYYSMLKEHDNEITAEVVTDRGIEALPNIELYMVRQHMLEGHETEAAILTDSLLEHYPESLVFMGGRGRGGRWVTVQEALDRIAAEQ
ncbi:MAG: hypothetical protein JRD49_11195 [Deltaproteobacteria bacterium]|nr:hypothetical protein [Deltaproteobacteria bacterium]